MTEKNTIIAREIIDSVTDQYIDVVLRESKEKLESISIGSNTLHLVLKFVMESVENTPVKGIKQRQLAIEVIRSLVTDLVKLEEEKIMLLSLVDSGSIGNTIDLVVSATRGELNINTVTQTVVGCCGTLLPYIIKKINKISKKKKSNDVSV